MTDKRQSGTGSRRRLRRARNLVLPAVIVAVALAGCQGGRPSASGTTGTAAGSSSTKARSADTGTVSVVMLGGPSSDPFFSTIKAGAKAAAAAYGSKLKLTYLALQNYDNLGPDMAKLEQTAASEDPNVIVSTDWTPAAQDPVFEQLIGKGLPVVLYNAGGSTEAQKIGAVNFIGTDDTNVGQIAGRTFVADGAKDIVCVNTTPGSQNNEDRCHGLIATATTTYNAPYDVARRFASLDFLSGGRAAWNAVTTASGRGAAENYGDQPHPERATRYERAAEFIEVVRKLWDSWDDDAIVADREARQYIRSGGVNSIDHVGEYFSVKGPLQIPRPPQGHPVIFQAGGSDQGRELAAREADGIFSLALERESAKQYADDIRRRARAYGRDPSAIIILPGLVSIIGGTEAEARAMQADLNERAGGGPSIQRLASILEIDPAGLSLDKPVPIELIPRTQDDVRGSFAFHNATADIARKGLTVREILQQGGGGHRLLVGAPEQVAESIIDWFEYGAADGFNLMPAAVPSGVEAFVDHVVPILQRRGVFRTEYTGTTLRDHFGLERRESRSRVAAVAAV